MAIKIPYMQLESDPNSFARFQREAEIGELLNHPNILKFIQVPNKSRPYIVTEYLEGKPLSTVLNEVRPLPITDAVQIASYVCGALAHMHETQGRPSGSQAAEHHDLRRWHAEDHRLRHRQIDRDAQTDVCRVHAGDGHA